MFTCLAVVFLTLLLVADGALDTSTNDFPIIGIFTQPSTSTEGDCSGDCLYLAASYVKYIEASGARVVPIDYHATETELEDLLGKINGVLFPGGGAAYPSAAQYTYDKIKAMNDAGDFMPLWGTCMGFQWLLIAQSGDVNILDPPSGQLDSYNLSIPLDFTSTFKESQIFSSAPQEITAILATQNVTMNNHHYGIFPDHFDATPELSSFFNVLSTNKDRQGVEFVSMIEAFKYPIIGSQWHPEKNNFEYEAAHRKPLFFIFNNLTIYFIFHIT